MSVALLVDPFGWTATGTHTHPMPTFKCSLPVAYESFWTGRVIHHSPVLLCVLSKHTYTLAKMLLTCMQALLRQFIYSCDTHASILYCAPSCPHEALLQREGSTQELELLCAEFILLDEQLAVFAETVQNPSSSLAEEEVLEKLAVNIPDLRSRVGVL